VPLSSPASDDAWRRHGTQQFSGNECASANNARRCFSSAHPVIAGTAIAAPIAANTHAVNSAAAPTNGTSKVPKDGSIIATGSGNTGAAAARRHRA
jgi:hypothetical protein